MAGIKVPLHKIYKISTSKLKYYKWNLTISEEEAIKNDEYISLFQGEIFRAIARLLKKKPEKIDYSRYLCALVVDNKSHYKRATSKKGFELNGEKFKRFVGTTGGLKSNTVLFVNDKIYDSLYEISECGRDRKIPFIPAKLEAYRALFCSASQPILSPSKILVVRDCEIKIQDDIINLDDSVGLEPKMDFLEKSEVINNISDGFSLCTVNYMEKISKALGLDYLPGGVCLRNAWFKGMLYPFPIIEFVDKYNNGNYLIEDIWGNTQDIRECEMITTESSFKLWQSYSSIEDYMEKYKKNGFEFSVTKIAPQVLEDEREVNYQYLQSYDFSDEDIKELCEPTVQYLKKAMCGDYESTLKFLGINDTLNDKSWKQGLLVNECMMKDSYVIDSVHRIIKKKIDEAKIGKIRVQGNYQIASGDPFALMQSICGLKVTGLLMANECYSQYWLDQRIEKVVVFRSPMTVHNNIRVCEISDSIEAQYWYKHMTNIMIINGFDTFCMAENGCDYDSDILFSTNNRILLKNYIPLPAIQCVQRNAEKIISTDADIIQSNLNGMGNKVGSITNKVTSMKEVQSRFEKDSEEWEILEYRMKCGQLYQQNELDKIKGILFNPMPSYWFSLRECKTELDKVLCANKKPYFFIYIYDYIKKEHSSYIKSVEKKCLKTFGITLESLLNKTNRDEEEDSFVQWYYFHFPVGMGPCSMNKVCWYIEQQFLDYKSQLKAEEPFDFYSLRYPKKCSEKNSQNIQQLLIDYTQQISRFKARSSSKARESEDFCYNSRTELKNYYKKQVEIVCPNEEERFNICLDLCYKSKGNKQFFWDVVGDLAIKKLESERNKC